VQSCGTGSVAGYSDWLRAGRSGDRIPVRARFSAPVQTGPGARPASCTMGTGSFPGGKKRPGRDADPSPPSSADGHERVELYLYSPYGLYVLYKASVPVQGCTLPFFYLSCAVLRHGHNVFQSQFYTDCDLVLHLPNSIILSFP